MKPSGKMPRLCWFKLAFVLLSLCLLLHFTGGSALAHPEKAAFTIGHGSYVVDGQSCQMDAAPFVDKNGRTMVPVRYLAYAVGVPEEGVCWDEAKQAVILCKGKVTLRLTLGDCLMERWSGDEPSVSRVMDVAPYMRKNRVFLPARYVAEAFGYEVRWDGARGRVSILSGSASTGASTGSPPTPSSPPARPRPSQRPATGTVIKDAGILTGQGKLTVENGLSYDAVAVLTPAGSKEALYAVYVRAKDSYTAAGIRDGAYNLYFVVGQDWDEGQKSFQKVVSRERFEEVLEFETESTWQGTRYTSIRVTLHQVVGGNAPTEEVSARQFPRL
jgi:hypothetical protein